MSARTKPPINCGAEILECASSPCVNGGSCLDYLGYFVCNCVPGYNDTVCATRECRLIVHDEWSTCAEINYCNSNPCQNNATCFEMVNAYECQCTVGWTDALCATGTNNYYS